MLKVVFILFLLSCSLGQLVRIPLPTQEIGLYLPDFLLLGSLGLYIVRLWREGGHPAQFTRPILAFVMITLSSLLFSFRLFNPKEIAIGSLYLFRWVSYVLVYFVTLKLAKMGSKNIIGFVLILTGLIVTIVGFVQLLIFPDFTPMTIYGWDPHYYRLVSSFFDPNFSGGFLVLTLSLIVSLYLFTPKKSLLFLSAIVYSALLLTYSRSAYFAFLISMAVPSILKSKKVIGVALVAFLFSLQMNPRARGRIEGAIAIDESAIHRFSSWETAFTIIKKHPFLGVGFNNYRYAQLKYGLLDVGDPRRGGHSGAGVDSSLLFILATTGSLGLLSFAGFLFLAAKKTFIHSRKSAYNLAFLSSLIGILFHSLFVNSLFYPPIMAFLWATLGLAEADVANF